MQTLTPTSVALHWVWQRTRATIKEPIRKLCKAPVYSRRLSPRGNSHFQSARKLETLVAGSREAFGVHGLYHLSWWHLYTEAVLRWLIFLSISPSLGHLAHLVGVFSWTLEEILETTRVSAWSLVEKNRWVLSGWLVCLSLCVSFQNEIFEGEHRRRPSVNRNSFSHEKNFVFSLGLLAR